jgi:hypothetical protein
MDKDRAATITAVATRGEQIKTNSAEYLWLCRGLKPPLLPDEPVATDPAVTSKDQHLRRFNSAAPATR